MTTVWLVLLTVIVGILGVLFFYLEKRMEKLVERMSIIYGNIDVLHKNQEELLAQNLRMFHDSRQRQEEERKRR